MAVGRGDEACGHVVAKERDGCGVTPVRHHQSAAGILCCSRLGERRLRAEGDARQVDDAARVDGQRSMSFSRRPVSIHAPIRGATVASLIWPSVMKKEGHDRVFGELSQFGLDPQSGWPRGTLLLTVVRDEKDEGHAVLTAIIDKGDYILDNQNNDILLWSEIRYRFIKRQSQTDPNVWISLSKQQPAIATSPSR